MSTGRWEFDENGNVHYVEGENSQNTTDGSYHYSYRKADQEKQTQTNRQVSKRADDRWHWVLIVLGFMVAWPIGLFLLFLQVLDKWPGNKEVSQGVQRVKSAFTQSGSRQTTTQTVRAERNPGTAPGNYGQTTAQVQERLERERARRAQTTQADQAAQNASQSKQKETKQATKARKKSEDPGLPFGLGHVKLFRWIGGIMAGLFGFAFVMELIDEIEYFVSWRYFLGETVPLLALCLIGVTLVALAGSRKRKLKKFQKYLAMVGKQEQVPIGALAETMGVSEKQAEKDLEEMLERDFWDEGYVDAARRLLVLGAPWEAKAEPEPEIDQEAPPEDENAATLRHIRDVNDAIANPELSEKIYRIEELTAKIFRLLEERPEKAGELRSFMNYYLPQTLKILENYSTLEAQGIEGENITEAKEKIEGMMDKLVDGYEAQLDKLFADDVLDISADLKVMEQMLEKDGLATDELKL